MMLFNIKSEKNDEEMLYDIVESLELIKIDIDTETYIWFIEIFRIVEYDEDTDEYLFTDIDNESHPVDLDDFEIFISKEEYDKLKNEELNHKFKRWKR